MEETTHNDIMQRITVVETNQANIERTQKEIADDVKEIKRQITSWKGFVGGIIFIVSAIWTALVFFADWFLKLKGGG